MLAGWTVGVESMRNLKLSFVAMPLGVGGEGVGGEGVGMSAVGAGLALDVGGNMWGTGYILSSNIISKHARGHNLKHDWQSRHLHPHIHAH